jgi:hypothetical protein
LDPKLCSEPFDINHAQIDRTLKTNKNNKVEIKIVLFFLISEFEHGTSSFTFNYFVLKKLSVYYINSVF